MTSRHPVGVAPLPDGSHLLHIGPQKTGSSALQTALHEQRARLRELGVVYPGPGFRARSAMGAGLGYTTPKGGPKGSMDAWRQMLSEVQDPSARLVCISHEAFGRGTDDQIVKTVEALGGERPHVLAVARRYDRLLPSQWQQRVKARLTLSYDDWLRIVLGEPAPDNRVWRNVWVPHDSVELARRWGDAVGRDNLTVLVADESDRTLLPSVVEAMLGVPAGLLAPSEQVVNRSMGYGEVELLRAVNQHYEDHEYSDERYHLLVNRGLVPSLLRSPRHPDDSSIPPLPAWAWEPLLARSRARAEGLATLGVRVVGDLASLLLPEQPPEGVVAEAGGPGDAARPSPTVPLEVAARALAGVVDAADREARRAAGDGDAPAPTG